MSGHAFGKVILCGEHAVVYGVPALAVGINRGAKALAKHVDGGPSVLELEGLPPMTVGDGSDLAKAFEALIAVSRVDRPVKVNASTDLPAGAGLGCSAALGVAIARALQALAGFGVSPPEIASRAMAWERVFHGNPSGIDATVAVLGGSVLFTRGAAIEEVRTNLPLTLAIAHSGLASSTRVMVESVATQRARATHEVDAIFEEIRDVVRMARVALEDGKLTTLGTALDRNQMLLERLHLSTPEIDRLCSIARTHGALGAKLTGAGGGGCVVALCAGPADAILAAWQAAGFEAFSATVEAHERPSAGRILTGA